MSEFFSWSCDGETASRCLQMMERAAQRVASGKSAFIGARGARGKIYLREGCKRKSVRRKRRAKQ